MEPSAHQSQQQQQQQRRQGHQQDQQTKLRLYHTMAPSEASSSVPMTPKTPRTPGGQGGKKKLSVRPPDAPKTVGGTPKKSVRHTMTMPENFTPSDHSVLVYELPKAKASIDNVQGKRQGVWQLGYSATVSPTELWLFRDGGEPHDVKGSKHIHGVWGLDPNAMDPGEPLPDDLSTVEPMHMWFFPPNAKLPQYFTPRGVWTYPLVKKDITQLQPEQAGFLHVTDSVKQDKLDVAGSWKMLYRRDGLPEAPIGPGLSPAKKSRAQPKAMTIYLQTPKGQKVALENVLPTETMEQIKDRVERLEGTPKGDQRLIFKNVELQYPKKNIASYGVKDQDLLEMQGITVYVQPPKDNGDKLTFGNLDPRATTVDLLQDLIEKNGGVPRKFQRLTFRGDPLDSPDESLKDAGIVHHSTVILEPLEIAVRTPQGQLIPLQLDPFDTLQEVKRQVQQKTELPIEEQRLQKDGKDLMGDTKPLAYHGIQHGDILDLQGMQIYVQDWDGKVSEYDVDPNDTIDDIKDKIQRQKGISKPSQRLSYQGKLLDKDRKTLRDYQIPNQATIVLEPMDLKVRTPQGNVLDLKVTPRHKIANVKKQLEDDHGIPADEQRLMYTGKHLGDGTTIEGNGIPNNAILDLEPMMIYVSDPKGKRFILENLDPLNTMDEIQTKLEDQERIPKPQQRLTFGGKPLNDPKKTLRDHGIKHKSTLTLDPMQIQVALPNGDVLPLQMQPNEAVSDIKAKLRDKHGIPIPEQRLEKDGTRLQDSDTLADAGIRHGDTIQMKPMKVIVHDIKNNREFPIEMLPTDTIDDLKGEVDALASVPKSEQRLVFDGKPLTKNKKTLRSCGIQNGSVVNLEPMTILVETPQGKQIPVPTAPKDTAADVKRKVQDLEGIPVEDQRLVFNGKELPDKSTIEVNGIQHGDVVKIQQGMEIVVKDWKQKSMTMEVKPSDTIASIRDRIAAVKEVEPQKQILAHKDTMLDENEKTLGECGIKHGAVISLDRFKIYVESPTHGKFLYECEPSWKIQRIQQSVEARFKIQMDLQQPYFGSTLLQDPKASIGDCGIGYKDTVLVKESNIPEYEVKIGAWQDPFAYNPKSPVRKKVGKRTKTVYDCSNDNFAESQGNTALSVDIWSKKEESSDGDAE